MSTTFPSSLRHLRTVLVFFLFSNGFPTFFLISRIFIFVISSWYIFSQHFQFLSSQYLFPSLAFLHDIEIFLHASCSSFQYVSPPSPFAFLPDRLRFSFTPVALPFHMCPHRLSFSFPRSLLSSFHTLPYYRFSHPSSPPVLSFPTSSSLSFSLTPFSLFSLSRISPSSISTKPHYLSVCLSLCLPI